MAFSGVDFTPPEAQSPVGRASSEEKKDSFGDVESPDAGSLAPGDHTQRRLKSRHIQLIGGWHPLSR